MLKLSSIQLDILESLIPDHEASPKGGRPPVSKRKALAGIFWILDNGAKWKDLPRRYSSKSSVHRWFLRWVKAGVFEQVMRSLGRMVEENGDFRLYECFVDVMLIGLDLDNTLADYAAPLERLCRERGIDPGGGDPKLALRGLLRAQGREAEWTQLQGELYGPLMNEARPFAGAADFVAAAARAGAVCIVVSHRTRRPISGQAHDLHASARAWLAGHGFDGLAVHLEESKQSKLARIDSLGLDMFVDDLPEVLLDAGFPGDVRRILFDPKREHAPVDALEPVDSWEALIGRLFK